VSAILVGSAVGHRLIESHRAEPRGESSAALISVWRICSVQAGSASLAKAPSDRHWQVVAPVAGVVGAAGVGERK